MRDTQIFRENKATAWSIWGAVHYRSSCITERLKSKRSACCAKGKISRSHKRLKRRTSSGSSSTLPSWTSRYVQGVWARVNDYRGYTTFASSSADSCFGFLRSFLEGLSSDATLHMYTCVHVCVYITTYVHVRVCARVWYVCICTHALRDRSKAPAKVQGVISCSPFLLMAEL